MLPSPVVEKFIPWLMSLVCYHCGDLHVVVLCCEVLQGLIVYTCPIVFSSFAKVLRGVYIDMYANHYNQKIVGNSTIEKPFKAVSTTKSTQISTAENPLKSVRVHIAMMFAHTIAN